MAKVTAAGIALTVLEELPRLVQMSEDVLAWVQRQRDVISTAQAEGRDPTPEEWDALHREIEALRGALHSGETTKGPPGRANETA